MSRPPADYRALHAAADSMQPRMYRAFMRSVAKMRAALNINDLAMAIAAKDVRRAHAVLGAMLSKAAMVDALTPCGSIMRDAMLRGGRVGAERLNKARGI